MITSATESDDFPITRNAFDRTINDYEGAVSIKSIDGRRLLFSSYLGGEDRENVISCDFIDDETVVACGWTDSNDFPITEGAMDREYADGTDGFLTSFTVEGELLFSTFVGARSRDEFWDCFFNDELGIMVGGIGGVGAPTTEGVYDGQNGGGYIVRLPREGNGIAMGTFIGDVFIKDLILDNQGGMIAVGGNAGDHFEITEGAIDDEPDLCYRDAFIARLSVDGERFLYGSYFGGSNWESIEGVATTVTGLLAVAGYTQSNDFPTTENAVQWNYGGERSDGFFAILDIGLPFLRWIEIPDTILVEEGEQVTFVVEVQSSLNEPEFSISFESPDLPEAVQFTDNGDGTGSFLWQTTFNDAGDYLATFTLSDGENEISADVVIIVSNVNRAPVWEEPVPERIDSNEGEALQLVIRALDPDNDSLRFEIEAQSLPAGWQFTDNGDGSARFDWRTTLDDAGEYTVTFTVSDGENEIGADVDIILLDLSSPSTPQSVIPTEVILANAFPNPFNSSTTIRFGLPVTGEASIRVTDTNGRLMATLVEGRHEAGYHEVVWEASGFPVGVYLLELTTNSAKIVRTAAIIK